MKDLFAILSDHGIEVPDDKAEALKKDVFANYKSVNEYNNALQKEREKASAAANTISDLQDKLKDFEGEDVQGLRDKIKEYEDAENTRKANEAQAAAESKKKARFNGLNGDKEYINEATEKWVFDHFKSALDDEKNAGKSDSEIFSEITKDQDIFKNPNARFETPPANGGGSTVSLEERNKVRSVMGLKPLKE